MLTSSLMLSSRWRGPGGIAGPGPKAPEIAIETVIPGKLGAAAEPNDVAAPPKEAKLLLREMADSF